MKNNSTLTFNETEYKFYKNDEVIELSINGKIVKYFTKHNVNELTLDVCIELINEYKNITI